MFPMLPAILKPQLGPLFPDETYGTSREWYVLDQQHNNATVVWHLLSINFRLFLIVYMDLRVQVGC